MMRFTQALSDVVNNDVLVANMPKIRIKTVPKGMRLNSMPKETTRDISPAEGPLASRRFHKDSVHLRSLYKDICTSSRFYVPNDAKKGTDPEHISAEDTMVHDTSRTEKYSTFRSPPNKRQRSMFYFTKTPKTTGLNTSIPTLEQ